MLQRLARQHHLNLWIDTLVFNPDLIEAPEHLPPLTAIPLDCLLRRLLVPAGADFIIRDGSIEVTTQARIEAEFYRGEALILRLCQPLNVFFIPSGYTSSTIPGYRPTRRTPMKLTRGLPFILLLLAFFAALQPHGAFAASYVFATQNDSATDGAITVINQATNTVISSSLAVGKDPIYGAAVTPNGKELYVANQGAGTVSVINTATQRVTNTITVGNQPWSLAVTPDGKKVYVVNNNTSGSTGTVSVISTSSHSVTSTISTGIGKQPEFVAITPDATKAYVTNTGANTVSVINTSTDAVITGTGYPISVGSAPTGIAITPDGTQAYVANNGTSRGSLPIPAKRFNPGFLVETQQNLVKFLGVT
jgi:YVTN family beta-propeller protein